jgi:hypothetical protein
MTVPDDVLDAVSITSSTTSTISAGRYADAVAASFRRYGS